MIFSGVFSVNISNLFAFALEYISQIVGNIKKILLLKICNTAPCCAFCNYAVRIKYKIMVIIFNHYQNGMVIVISFCNI